MYTRVARAPLDMYHIQRYMDMYMDMLGTMKEHCSVNVQNGAKQPANNNKTRF